MKKAKTVATVHTRSFIEKVKVKTPLFVVIKRQAIVDKDNGLSFSCSNLILICMDK